MECLQHYLLYLSQTYGMLLIIMTLIPILAFVLIVAGFAPSVYGQAFPAERALFLCRLVMTAALMIEGACLGIFLRSGRCAGHQRRHCWR